MSDIMSTWIEIKKEDIDTDKEEITFHVNSDDCGNNYGVIKIKDLKEILKQYEN